MTIERFLKYIKENGINKNIKICFIKENGIIKEADAIIYNPELNALFFSGNEEIEELIAEDKAKIDKVIDHNGFNITS